MEALSIPTNTTQKSPPGYMAIQLAPFATVAIARYMGKSWKTAILFGAIAYVVPRILVRAAISNA